MDGTTMNNTSSASRASRIEIAANEAVSVKVTLGAAIQCARGTVWITQNGDLRDYCILAGTTFCADRGGRVVLTALDGASVVLVSEAGARSAGYVPGAVTIDSMDRITRDARAARAKAVASLVGTAFAWLSTAFKRLGRAGRSRSANIERTCLRDERSHA
jgi:hypothetical protein